MKGLIEIKSNRKTDNNVVDVAMGCSNKCGYCYASTTYKRYGWDHSNVTKRQFDKSKFEKSLKKCPNNWVRIGVMSDPSLDWDNVVQVCQSLYEQKKTPVIITKIVKEPTFKQLKELIKCKAQLQVSFDALMSWDKIKCLEDFGFKYIRNGGWMYSRIISAHYNTQPEISKQDYILNLPFKTLETPMRVTKTNTIYNKFKPEMYTRYNSVITGKGTSMIYPKSYLTDGLKCNTKCSDCKHQCMTII